MRVDEILDALPGVGLRLGLLQEKAGDTLARWYALVAEEAFGPDSIRWDGWGATPLDALTMALRRAGVDVTDG